MANKPSITFAQSRLAMKWWNNLSIESRAYLRKTHRLHAVDAIARYWLSSIASPEESRIALRKEQ
jgi:hypothetical protein